MMLVTVLPRFDMRSLAVAKQPRHRAHQHMLEEAVAAASRYSFRCVICRVGLCGKTQ
jgi:hypothetical protein